MHVTLIGSQEYKSRFREAMNRYILQGNLSPSTYIKLSKTIYSSKQLASMAADRIEAAKGDKERDNSR
jgi:hypothetical protein